ncbi:MAG: PA14 domain-containing protein, partial [Limisphaerales bacterium]
PPTLVSAAADGSFTTVTVQFDGPMGASALTPANYTITPSVAVTAVAAVPVATGSDIFNTVRLTTAKQALDTAYTLAISTNVKDLGGNSIAANTTANFQSAKQLPGFAFYERWNDAAGDMGSLDQFAAALADDTARIPDVSNTVTQFGGPWGAADNYNARVRTYFTPPSAGNYVFFVSADDGANLFLSTDDTAANKKLIAKESGWSNQYQWTAPGNGAADDKRSDLYASTEWENGNTITLQANKTYYMEVQWNEGGGGDGADVTFIKEGEDDPANSTAGMFMRGNVISWFATTDSLAPSITSPMAFVAVTLDAGVTTNLSVVAEFATGYQWQRDGVNIAGATSADYAITGAEPDDIGQYWCQVSNKNGTIQSASFFVLVKATGVFAIEAEDFDYDSGKSMDAASVMPYLGGAYDGLSAVLGVDYQNDDNPANNQEDGHPVYRYGDDLDVTAQGATASREQPGGQFSITRAGEWEMTANYKIGWVGTGNWGNYTRTFPTPAKTYNVFAASSADNHAAGRLVGSIGEVTAGVGTATQTVAPLASYNAPGTGAWSRNSLVGMRESNGALTSVELGGKKTIRWNYDGGDAEYLLFIPATSVVGPNIAITPAGIITYTGTLEASATVNTGYAPVAGAASPYTVPKTGAAMFYRAKQ